MPQQQNSSGQRPAGNVLYLIVASILVLSVIPYAAFLDAMLPDLYYGSVQEDEYVEWASFWLFVLAAVAAVVAALRYRSNTARLPWFLIGVALFCFFVAMEEISWGQRVLGYRPPVYFLEHNYQQEFNLHNVVETDYRKLALSLVILGYGVVLPLLSLFGPLQRLLTRAGVVPPPAGLVPAFAATYLVYDIYPWRFSGEWVELMLGAGFLLSLLPGISPATATGSRMRPAGIAVGLWVLAVALGLATSAVSRAQRDAHPEILQAARVEVAALQRDFESGRVRSRCNLHKRLYTFTVEYGQNGLLSGEFAGLVAQGLPEERAAFLLDPWNSPYWLRDRCDREAGRRILFVYSFGPNRRRDSTATELRDDDVGTYISIR